MKKGKKMKGAEAFGMKGTHDPLLDKYSKMDLRPEKGAEANKTLSNIKWWKKYPDA